MMLCSDSAPSTVSAIIVGWNSLRYLEACFDSLVTQTMPPAEIIYVDNGSTDGSQAWLRQHYPAVRILQNEKNLGFCTANNQGIVASTGTHVLLVNSDVILRPDFIEVLVTELQGDPQFGWGCGKLLRLVPGQDPDAGTQHRIDSAGEIVMKSRRAVNRGAEHIDAGQYDTREEIWGATAAAALYRREMLEDTRLGEDYFDRDYFAYMEDCDLNWRARLRGWKCIYQPAAVGFHVRHQPTGRNLFIQRRAHFNRYLNILKNETGWNLLLALPHIFLYDLFWNLRVLFRDPAILGGVFSTVPRLFRALARRRLIQRRRRVDSKTIRSWMHSETYFRSFLKQFRRKKEPVDQHPAARHAQTQ